MNEIIDLAEEDSPTAQQREVNQDDPIIDTMIEFQSEDQQQDEPVAEAVQDGLIPSDENLLFTIDELLASPSWQQDQQQQQIRKRQHTTDNPNNDDNTNNNNNSSSSNVYDPNKQIKEEPLSP
jgi:hypothetical protein